MRADIASASPVDWQALVTEHLDFAREVARKQARRMPMPAEDIESAAMLGLVQAARAWRPDGKPFTVFAEWRIKGAILDDAREADDLSRDHRQAVKAGKLEAPRRESMDDELISRRIAGDVGGGTSVGEWMSATEMHQLLRHLPRRMQTVVRRYLVDDLSLAEVGAELGVTESRACQIFREAKERLRMRLLPYEPEVDEEHRRQWHKRGCRRQEVCLRGHELTGYNVVSQTRTTPRKTKAPTVSTIRLCRRCLLERAKRFRRAQGTVPFAAFRQPRHKLAKLSDQQVRDIYCALMAGDRVTDLGRRYGVAHLVIRLIRDGKTYRDVPRPAGFVTGKRRPAGKLTAEQVWTIVGRLAKGEQAHSIAVEFGVSDPTISDIRRGRYHRRVPRPPELETDARKRPGSRAKLTIAQVREAKVALAAGVIVAEVARRLHVSWQTVGALRDGRSYRYVEASAEESRSA